MTTAKIRLKRVRALQIDLPSLTRKVPKQRKNPPGQHGANRRSGKMSVYKERLLQKQIVRHNYGLRENQLRKIFARAARSKMETGAEFLALLEARLDNVVFRAGFAPTILAARQLVSHRHVLVNGKRVNIPSYTVKTNDQIVIMPKSIQMPIIQETIKSPTLSVPNYLNVDQDKLLAKMLQKPEVSDVPLQVQVNLIIEFYSRVGT